MHHASFYEESFILIFVLNSSLQYDYNLLSRTNITFNSTHVLGISAVAQWIRPRTSSCDVPSSNLPVAAVVPLGKALYPHCLVPRKGLKAVGPWLLAYKQLAFLVAR